MDYSNHNKTLEYLASFFNGAILYSKNRQQKPHLRISANQYGQFNIAIEKYLEDNKSHYIPFPLVICAATLLLH